MDRKLKNRRINSKKHSFKPTQMIAFGFLTAILIGSLILTLPISAADGNNTNYIDALFTATTSVCVTGLVTVNTMRHWSLFGQFIILLLIQFGGLGVMTFTTTILLILRKKITLKERLLIQEAYNLDTLRGLVKLTKKIIKGTLLIEAVGALLYCFIFIPEFGFLSGLWKSVFNSVAAFCNAGMDILGDYSLTPYRGNLLINLITITLIVLGGIGYPVWWDVVGKTKKYIKNRKKEKIFHKFELHTKIVLTTTFLLITVGGLVLFLLEYRNPDTIGQLPLGEKIMASMFQSVTTRTAGFLTIPQESLTPGGAFASILLMFVGGSPSSTAGGIKTVTLTVLIMAVISTIKGRQDVEVFRRKIADSYVKKALAVTGVSTLVLITSTILLAGVEDKHFLNLLYETTSAIATVGLTRGITPDLSDVGKLIVIACMYLGRIGPITMALAFNINRTKGIVGSLPEEKVLVG